MILIFHLKSYMKKYLIYLSIPLFLWNIKSISYYTKSALILWYETILPSQFVSIVLLNLLKEVSTKKDTKTIPEIPKIMVLGLFFGFPAGAILVKDSFQRGKITKAEATILLPVCNMFGPAYIFGYFYPTYQGSFSPFFNKKGFCIAYYGIPILYGTVFFMVKCIHQLIVKNKKAINCHEKSNETLRNIPSQKSFSDIITNSLVTISKLSGYMMFFSSLQFLVDLIPCHEQIRMLAKALFEISTALQISDALFPPISLFFLTFGCISALAQTACILAEIRLSIFPYLLQKLLLGLLALISIQVLPF